MTFFEWKDKRDVIGCRAIEMAGIDKKEGKLAKERRSYIVRENCRVDS
jgi:hypothetical protein